MSFIRHYEWIGHSITPCRRPVNYQLLKRTDSQRRRLEVSDSRKSFKMQRYMQIIACFQQRFLRMSNCKHRLHRGSWPTVVRVSSPIDSPRSGSVFVSFEGTGRHTNDISSASCIFNISSHKHRNLWKNVEILLPPHSHTHTNKQTPTHAHSLTRSNAAESADTEEMHSTGSHRTLSRVYNNLQ